MCFLSLRVESLDNIRLHTYRSVQADDHFLRRNRLAGLFLFRALAKVQLFSSQSSILAQYQLSTSTVLTQYQIQYCLSTMSLLSQYSLIIFLYQLSIMGQGSELIQFTHTELTKFTKQFQRSRAFSINSVLTQYQLSTSSVLTQY